MNREQVARARWVGAVVVLVAVVPQAPGFYFRGWPAGPPNTPSLVPSAGTTTVHPPTTGSDPPPGTSGHSDPPTTSVPPGVDTGPTAPEPGTAALAAVGLAVVGVARRRVQAA